MPVTSLQQLPDRVGRYLLWADEFKSSPFWTKAKLDYEKWLFRGACAGACSLWLQLLMCRAPYTGSLSRIADIATALGCDQSGIIDGTGQGVIPSVAYYGKSSGLAVTLAFAGTTEVSQWLSFMAAQDQVEHPGVTGKVFQALGDIAAATWPKVATFLDGWNTDCMVGMCGHSLGGALAEICARRVLSQRTQKMGTVCIFGSPRVGNGDFANVTRPYIDRVVLEGDPVPDLPPPVFTRQAISGAFGRATSVVPTIYRHSNCTRIQISTKRRPERSEAGPRYENMVPLSEVSLALSLDGFAARHGSAAYESALVPWISEEPKAAEWFGLAAAASADMKMVTGY